MRKPDNSNDDGEEQQTEEGEKFVIIGKLHLGGKVYHYPLEVVLNTERLAALMRQHLTQGVDIQQALADEYASVHKLQVAQESAPAGDRTRSTRSRSSERSGSQRQPRTFTDGELERVDPNQRPPKKRGPKSEERELWEAKITSMGLTVEEAERRLDAGERL